MHQNQLHRTNHKKTRKKPRPLQRNPTMTITITITSENPGQAAETTGTSYHPTQGQAEIPIPITQAAQATHHINQMTHFTPITQFKSDDRKDGEWKYSYST